MIFGEVFFLVGRIGDHGGQELCVTANALLLPLQPPTSPSITPTLAGVEATIDTAAGTTKAAVKTVMNHPLGVAGAAAVTAYAQAQAAAAAGEE